MCETCIESCVTLLEGAAEAPGRILLVWFAELQCPFDGLKAVLEATVLKMKFCG